MISKGENPRKNVVLISCPVNLDLHCFQKDRMMWVQQDNIDAIDEDGTQAQS